MDVFISGQMKIHGTEHKLHGPCFATFWGLSGYGFNIQRVNPEGKWVVHLRPTEKGRQRIKKKIKDLSTRGWTWLDEYIQLTRLNALARGWAEYYKHTSLR